MNGSYHAIQQRGKRKTGELMSFEGFNKKEGGEMIDVYRWGEGARKEKATAINMSKI